MASPLDKLNKLKKKAAIGQSLEEKRNQELSDQPNNNRASNEEEKKVHDLDHQTIVDSTAQDLKKNNPDPKNENNNDLSTENDLNSSTSPKNEVSNNSSSKKTSKEKEGSIKTVGRVGGPHKEEKKKNNARSEREIIKIITEGKSEFKKEKLESVYLYKKNKERVNRIKKIYAVSEVDILNNLFELFWEDVKDVVLEDGIKMMSEFD